MLLFCHALLNMVYILKIALVTGASSGIGRDLSILLARSGYSVALASRRVEVLEDIAKRIRSEGGSAEPIKTDLSSLDEASALIDRVIKSFGGIDVLVNNAGFGIYGPIDEVDESDIYRIYMVNTIAPVILIKKAVPHMRAKGGGCIVNISSLAAYTPMPWLSLYVSSKAAIKSLTDSLRIELKPHGIRVIGVYPGYVDTEFHRSVILTRTASKIRWGSSRHPLTPMLQSEHVAREIVKGIKDPDFNRDIVIGARYKLVKMFSQHLGWLVTRSLENMYRRNIERAGILGE